jgi:hypothetical protein
MASTKKVVTKGNRRVNQGQLVAIATIKAAVEMKNNNQYNPFLFLFTSMEKFCAKIGQMIKIQNRKKKNLYSCL